MRHARWPAIAAAVYLLLYGLVVAHPKLREAAPSFCVFRAISGVPCPTCGGTRATLALASGDLRLAFRYNPLVAGAWLVAPAAALAALWYRRAGRRRQSRFPAWLTVRVLLPLIIAALAANWAYVLTHLPQMERSAGPDAAMPTGGGTSPGDT